MWGKRWVDNEKIKLKKKRGRPEGFRLSDESKDRIRESRYGKHHSEETKNKIARSLIRHFREQDPLSENIRYDYRYFPPYIDEWIINNKRDIDQTKHVITDKKLLFLNQLELRFGAEIDRFSHNATPEFFIMLKEELIEKGLEEELEILYSLL